MIVNSLLLFTAAIYGWGVIRMRHERRSIGIVHVVAFLCGLITIAAAVDGPLDALADASLSWHMVQHLLLIALAAPLLLIGAPIRVALGALPRRFAKRFARILNSRAMQVVDHPVFGLAVLTLVLYGTHFSPLYELALEHENLHAGEHLLYITCALVYWSPIFAVAPAPHAPSHPARILALFLSLPMSAFLGFALYVENHVLYAHYASQPNALADQMNAGVVMWLTAGTPVLLAILWCVADWGARERRIGAAYDALETRTDIVAPTASVL